MKKIRITIINGSYHQKGKTIGIANEFTSLLEKKLYKYTLVINRIELNNSKLETCRGCKNCFSNGICRLDKIDDMHKIKRILCMSGCSNFFFTSIFKNDNGIHEINFRSISILDTYF